MTDLNGATALVTGAASGIGLRMAEQFARRGASLVLWDLNGEALESARARVARAGNVAHTDTVDVGDLVSVEGHIVCGHCHDAKEEEFELGGRKGRLYTLGAWEEEAAYLEFSEGEFRPRVFPGR